MSNKEKKKEIKARAYRISIICIIFIFLGASIFTWLPFVKGVPKVVIIVVACVFVVAFIAVQLWAELSYLKRNGKLGRKNKNNGDSNG